MGGYVDFYCVKPYSNYPNIIGMIFNALYVYKKSFQYDCIYDTLNTCSYILGKLKKARLLKTKLITIMHHPSYRKQLQSGESDAYIFFEKCYYDEAVKDCPAKKQKYHVNEWWPDTEWYKNILKDNYETIGKIDFIDNGKTQRDHELVIKSCDSAKMYCLMPESNEVKGIYIKEYKMNLKDDIEQVFRNKMAKVMLVPVQKQDKTLGPIGITSFMDAVALNMPIICSNNTCFSQYVIQNKLGIVYTAGNFEELVEAMKKFNDNKYYVKCVSNMKKFSQGKSINIYSSKLENILKEVVQEA